MTFAKSRKFLVTKLINSRYIHVDYWSFLHLALFFVIGTIYPNMWGVVIIGMILFEAIEASLSKKIPYLREEQKDTFSDLGFNLLGYWLAHIM